MTTARVGPRTQLSSINWTQITILVGPFIPDGNAVFLEVLYVGVAPQKPQQFENDGLQMAFLRGYQGKAFGQVEAHLMAEYGKRAGAGAIGFSASVLQHVPHEFEVLAHGN